jgi:hypothetical protein
LVSKISFEAGVANGSYTVMMSQCQITGWMNETIGSFTCTKKCGPPTNYSEVFDWDWSESDGTEIGITIQ